MTDYSTWTSEDGKHHLVLRYDKDLKAEFEILQNKLKDKIPELEFKCHNEGDRHFVKVDEKVENMALLWVFINYVI